MPRKLGEQGEARGPRLLPSESRSKLPTSQMLKAYRSDERKTNVMEQLEYSTPRTEHLVGIYYLCRVTINNGLDDPIGQWIKSHRSLKVLSLMKLRQVASVSPDFCVLRSSLLLILVSTTTQNVCHQQGKYRPSPNSLPRP